MLIKNRNAFFLFILLLGPGIAQVDARRYTLWSGSIKGGGARAIGMAGAFTGLPDDHFGVLENPAGPAMTAYPLALVFGGSRVQDSYQSASGTAFNYFTAGFVLPGDDYGGALSFSVPYGYQDPIGDTVQLSEFRISAAKSFLSNRLAIGAALIPSMLYLTSETKSALFLSFGALYRFPKRLFLGVTYSPEFIIGLDSRSRSFSLPHQLALGTAWVPNRFFRSALTLKWIARESDTFRFSDPQTLVGIRDSLQLHLGLDYQALSLTHLQGRLLLGTYWEDARGVQNSRLHFTGGIEFSPWFFRIGAGVDVAQGYNNLAFGAGVDLGDVLRFLKLHPPEVPPPSGGLFPNPFEPSDDWLPSTMQDNPEDAFQAIPADIEDYPKHMNLPIPVGEDQKPKP